MIHTVVNFRFAGSSEVDGRPFDPRTMVKAMHTTQPTAAGAGTLLPKATSVGYYRPDSFISCSYRLLLSFDKERRKWL